MAPRIIVKFVALAAVVAAVIVVAGRAQKAACTEVGQNGSCPLLSSLVSANECQLQPIQQLNYQNQFHYEFRHQPQKQRKPKAKETNKITINYKHQNVSQPPPAFIANDANYSLQDMNIIETFFYQFTRTYSKNWSIEDTWRAGLLARYYMLEFGYIFTHRYNSFDELRKSSASATSQHKCLTQLSSMRERVDNWLAEGPKSRDVNILAVLDTFGRMPSGIFGGKTLWLGDKQQCEQLSIKPQSQLNNNNEADIKTRFCIMHFGLERLHSKFETEFFNFGIGVCLPASCDSTFEPRKTDNIMAMINANTYMIGRPYGTSLYCFPDEASEARSWWLKPKSALFAAAVASWLCLVGLASYKYHVAEAERQKRHLEALTDGLTTKPRSESVASAKIGLTNGFDASLSQSKPSHTKIWRLLSVQYNANSLFATNKQSKLLDQVNSSDTIGRNTNTSKTNDNKRGKIVDLSIVEGIKVICLVYVITAHVLMYSSITMENGRESANNLFVTLSFIMPAVAVNSFFCITGLLTAYLMLKSGQSASSFGKWITFAAYRYCRIMPVYVLIVAYLKYFAKFSSSGPLWDYATSSLSPRKRCEDESWLWILLFGANFKVPTEHCVPSAWYLANDFQFFLVTPFFLLLIHKSPRTGKRILVAATLLFYLAAVLDMYLSPIEDLRPLSKFQLHAFKLYVNKMSSSYTWPIFRIPAYFIGLLYGHLLFEYEQRSINDQEEKDKENNKPRKNTHLHVPGSLSQYESKQQLDEQELQEPQSGDAFVAQGSNWPQFFFKYGAYFAYFIPLVNIVTPFVGRHIPFNLYWARIAASFINPLYYVLYSGSIGAYVLLATTGHGSKMLNKLLAASFWKPLSRASLVVMLCNCEVVNYIISTSNHTQIYDDKDRFMLNTVCIIVTYIVSIIVCILFEAPIRALLNYGLTQLMTKMAQKQKQKKA